MEHLKTISTVPMGDLVFLNMPQMQTRYNLGRITLDEIATKIGAKVKVGRRTLYSREKMDAWANSLCTCRPGEKIDTFAGSGGMKQGLQAAKTAREDIDGRETDVCEEGH